MLIGTSFAFIVGVMFGLLRSQLPKKIKSNIAVTFMLDAVKYPPPIAWIPFVILYFGIGNFAASLIVFIGAFSPIFSNTYDGIENLPLRIKNLIPSFELSLFKKIQVLLMTALPQIFTGLKIGVGMGWMSVIAAEMLSGQNGLGYAIQIHRLNMQYTEMSIDMFCIAMVGFLLNVLFIQLEKYFLRWDDRNHA